MAHSGRGNRRKGKGRQLFAALLVLVVMAALMALVPGFEDGIYTLLGMNRVNVAAARQVDVPTKVHIIDVGQGDATLLEQNGTFALIDAGPPEGRDNLLGYLDGIGVKILDYVIMTHPHADHIGSMAEVLERYEVRRVILPDFDKAPMPTSSLFIKVLQAIGDGEIPAETAVLGAEYPLGIGSIRLIQNGLETKDNYNLLSLVTLFEAEGLRVLSTGDAEKANEKALLECGANLRADVYIAGHHGSSTSSTSDFLQAVLPAMVGISCAADNSYGHPHREPMEVFGRVNAIVLRTDTDGHVVVGKTPEGELQYAVTAAA